VDVSFEEKGNAKRGVLPGSKPAAAVAGKNPKGPAGNGEGRTGGAEPNIRTSLLSLNL